MPSVLVVDDDLALRAATTRFLKVLGLDTESVESAEAAVSALGERAYDVVVTDLQMVGLSGLDLLAHVRSAAPGTRCILVSGGLQEEDMRLAETLGVFRVLEKPFTFAALATAVHEALSFSP